MSLIERLAEKLGNHLSDKGTVTRESLAVVALNAIADELDGPSRPMERWAGWDSAIATLRHAQANEIRSQANPDSAESG